MDKLHSAYWFDGIEKNWKLYWEFLIDNYWY